MRNRHVRPYLAGGVLVTAAAASSSQAVPITSDIPGTASPVTATVLTNDLLQTQLASATLDSGTIDGEGTTDLNIVANGIFQTDNLQLLTPRTGAVVRYTLNTTLNTQGYNITAINSYGGWNDNGRDRQTFTIEYSTVGNPTTFLPVDSVNYEPANADGGDSGSLAAFTTNLTNVGQLRFTFGDQENGHAGYGEFDVIGTAAPVPEPSVIGLAVVGAAGLLRRRRSSAS